MSGAIKEIRCAGCGKPMPFPSIETPYECACGVGKIGPALTTTAQGLDAATIERCAQAIDRIAATLPSNERYAFGVLIGAKKAVLALNTASTTTRGEDARLREAAQAVLDSAERPGSRAEYGISEDGTEVWHDYQEVGQRVLDDLRAALQADAAHTSQEKGE